MPTKKIAISATEAARNLSDLLNRIRYRGECFIIVRNGEAIAEMAPPPATAGTVGTLMSRLSAFPPLDGGFAEDLAEIRKSQSPMPEDSWGS